MRRKWVYLAVTALVVGGAVTTAAARLGMRGGRMDHAIAAQLDLSDTQKAQLEELRSEHRKAMQALRDSGARPDREAIEALRETHREKMAEILTEEQLAKLEEWRAQRSGQGRRGWGSHMGRGPQAMGNRGMGPGRPWDVQMGNGPMREGPQGAAVLMRLDLTDKQRDTISALREQHREEMRELTAKHRIALEKVLTKEQREELAQMKDDALYGRGRGGGRR